MTNATSSDTSTESLTLRQKISSLRNKNTSSVADHAIRKAQQNEDEIKLIYQNLGHVDTVNSFSEKATFKNVEILIIKRFF
jgi:hypothetical protein